MKKIAIIPARSGSKGLKNKNIIELCGKPLMAYSIEAAIESSLFSRVIVTTDSVEYGQIAAEYGAEVVYREESVSNDTASTYMVLENLFDKIEPDFDYFVLLQPTSPMRSAKHIREAVSMFEAGYMNFDFLVSLKEAEYANILVKPVGEDKSLRFFDTDFSDYKRQKFKEYSPNGAIFIAKKEEYIKRKHFFGARSMAYFMNKMDSVDIDDEIDYRIAGMLMEMRLNEIN